MTKLLEEALALVREMPATEQDNIANAILSMAKLGDVEPLDVDPDELRDATDALAEVRRGEVATPEEVSAAWRSFER